MASIYDVKPLFQKLLRPVMRALAKNRVTPNAVTLAALLGSFGVGVLVVAGRDSALVLGVLPVWLFVRMALNAIDGMMARELGMSSDVGAVLNEAGDVLSDIFLYFPLAAWEAGASGAVVVFVLVAVLTEFCGVLGKALGADRDYSGPMGKSDRAFFVGALALGTACAPSLIAWWRPLFYLAALLGLLTCWNRIRRALGLLRKGKVS